MAQNDMDIANAAGAAFRADINSALQALAGTNSGATAPSVTYAYQWWADTTTALMKQRNAANTGWVIRGTLSEDRMPATKAAAYTLGVAHYEQFHDCVHATGFTITLTAAATMGDGFRATIRNSGAGNITLDGNASETIDGTTTRIIYPGETVQLVCTGTAWLTFGKTPDVLTTSGVTLGPVESTGTTTLDVYKESITAAPGVTGFGGTVSGVSAQYTRTGNLITMTVDINGTSMTTTRGSSSIGVGAVDWSVGDATYLPWSAVDPIFAATGSVWVDSGTTLSSACQINAAGGAINLGTIAACSRIVATLTWRCA
jgi:hypothetical protein